MPKDRIFAVTDEQLADAFDKWLDDSINHPEEFLQQWQTIQRHLAEKTANVRSTYGTRCVGYLRSILGTN